MGYVSYKIQIKEFLMKNFVKWFGIIAFAVVIGFSFATCKKDALDGTTWKADDGNYVLKFNSPNMTLIEDGDTETGTYVISGSTVTLNIDGGTETGTLSGSTLSFEDGPTFTKQGSSSKNKGGSSALVGRWVHESGVTRNKPENMELLKDGTGICDGTSITWKLEGNRLIIQSSLIGLACDYQISGSKLTLMYDDGGSAIFIKR
jgi:hypothetical protein